ncbi:MAG: arylsulfatase [Promethearchaeota archaeon]
MKSTPNIVLILADDMGYSDIGCYGGEINTPNLDSLALDGIRLTQFYNTARCSPSRASLLTGLHPHQTGIGILVADHGPEGYAGTINKHCITIAELLKQNGYKTYMSGKWHVSHDAKNPNDSWPCQRGFDHHYGTIAGAGSYFDPISLTRDNKNIEHEAHETPDFYYTDAISDNAVKFIKQHSKNHHDAPFFLYVAYTCPHWPLHAKEKDIKKYEGRFDEGWDELRKARMKRMTEMGIINPKWKLTPRDPYKKPWSKEKHKKWQARRMEVYAAQIDCMDQGIGRIIDALKKTNNFNNTLFIFLSDNGGCAEGISNFYWFKKDLIQKGVAREFTRNNDKVYIGNNPKIMPGPENTYQSYGTCWANLSNTPFRLYKHWTHEGGIATPFIVHWPDGINNKGQILHQPAQLTDVMATIVDITGFTYPKKYKGQEIYPLEGTSLFPIFNGAENKKRMLFFEHEGNAAVRQDNWKLVRDYPFDWELYNVEEDRTELHNVIRQHPEIARRLISAYESWANRVGVIPFNKALNLELKFLKPPFRNLVASIIKKYFFSKRKWQKIVNQE